MRFRSLSIEKYGAFTERSIEIPAESGLVVLYGPNEAGKSTCLSAVCDFLFGIPHNSPHGEIFGYGQMHIGASLSMADGRTLDLRRRKGRQDRSLSDASGQRVDEVVLSHCLGATGRDRFLTLFGIDHAALRAGGDRLLAADGDVGRLILEAGGGLRCLVEAIERIRAEAERNYTSRRSAERLFYKALDAFEAADRAAREATLTREVLDAALQRQRLALEAKEGLRAQHRDASERALRLQRLVRVVPSLQQLHVIDQELAGFDDLVPLPDDFPERARDASAQLKPAIAALRETEERQAMVAAKLAAIEVPATLLEVEATVRDVVEKAVTVRKARADRINRQHELAESEAKLAAVRTGIALPAGADLGAMAPAPAIIERVQRLANRGLELRTGIEATRKQHAIDTASLEHLHRRRADAECTGASRPPCASAADLATLPRASTAFDEGTQQAARLRDDIAQQVATLGFASLQEVALFRCPDGAVVQSEIEARNALAGEIAKLAERIAEETARRDAAEAEIARITGSTTAVSAADVTSARRTRDEVWAGIRALYVDADEDALAAQPRAQRQKDAALLGHLTLEADRLADRQVDEAERAAALDILTRQRADAQAAMTAFAAERAGLESRALAAAAAWQNAWPEAARWSDLGALKRAVEQRRSLLADAETLAAAERTLARMQSELSPQMSALAAVERQLGIDAGASPSLAERVHAALCAIRSHEEAHADYRANEAGIRELTLRMTQTEASLRDQQEALARWRDEWSTLVRSLALDPDVSPERGNEIATLWAKASGVLDTLRITQTRLRKMDEDEAKLKQQVDALAAHSRLILPKDAVAAAEMLGERLDAARKLATVRDELTAQLRDLETEKQAKEAAQNRTEQAIEALCGEAGCDRNDLLSLAARCEERQRTTELRRNLVEKITLAGDGLGIAALKEQWSGRDLDAIGAELSDAETEICRLAKQTEDAVLHLQDIGREVHAFSESAGINAWVAARESATAEIHQILCRYIEHMLAHDLLSAAMDRVRSEQQDPLVLRASELFAKATRNAFTAIETDIDGRGEPFVLGRRASGETVHVARMSDGTRDQLFLAFRLAAIEQYCRATEPLPLVADDLLVHFDDERSAATLDLLADFGNVTQVLLFTHHRRIVEVAQPLAAEGRVHILEMACA
jgi:uncharacterized protein YhaN